MRLSTPSLLPFSILVALFLVAIPARGGIFRVATYNVETYLDTPTQNHPAKKPAAKQKVRECIIALHPDVLALQELGSTAALLELRSSLETDGLNFPHWLFLSAADTNVHVAVLSRFPFRSIRSYTNESFLVNGRRFRVSRGFAEVVVEVNPSYSFTLIAAHLKSKRVLIDADESEVRLEEARLLREKIDAQLAAEPNINLVVLGDFNDTRDSESIKTIMGHAKTRLIDTRPAEKNAYATSGTPPLENHRSVTWTHYYGKEDTYHRIDYLLLSKGMAREWIPQETYVLAVSDWGVASDHRPVVAAFEAEDK